MNTATLLGSRLAQIGLADEIRQIESTQGPLAARRRAIELLMASSGAKHTERRRECVLAR